MSPPDTSPSAVLSTQRTIHASPRRIFTAFEQPDQLARWWGPTGFTNTFERFDFTPGGQWIFTMHGPDGADYPNQSVFREIHPDSRVVLEHVVTPRFTLTVTLSPRGDHTHLTWDQQFDNPQVADSLRAVCIPANEQNLDRLEALLAGQTP